VRKRRRAHHLERRGFALHEGLSQNPWSFQLVVWRAWWMHGELIHGATLIIFCSGAFAWRRAHLRRRAHHYSFSCSPGDEHLSDLREV